MRGGGNETQAECPVGPLARNQRHFLRSILLWLAGLSGAIAAPAPQPVDRPWASWRGPLATGASADAKPPLHWSEKENVRWKTAVPGLGHSSPVIAGGRIFLTTAIPIGEARPAVFNEVPGAHDNQGVTHTHEFSVLAVDQANGKVLWQKSLDKSFPSEGCHVTASYASGSPVTDGVHVWAFFGSHGLYCLKCDDGSLVWKKDLGRLNVHHAHGEGASPCLHEGALIIPWDQETGSCLYVLDAHTGAERWHALRPAEITSWSTPIIAPGPSGPQIITSATQKIRAYDLAKGSLIWECSGLARNVIASPVTTDGVVICGSSYDQRSMIAVTLDGATGDVTGTPHIAWSTTQRTPYVPSPALVQGRLYYLGHYQGILSCVKATTGERLAGPIRIDDVTDVYSSPVAANGRLYITDRSGLTVIIGQTDALPELARNHLDDRFSATAALAGPDMFLRGEKWLYCLREGAKPQ